MTIRPILFSAPMVRALLDGRKTMTRRVLKPQPARPAFGDGYWYDAGAPARDIMEGEPEITRFAPGDLLWVRETFSGVHEYEREKWPPSAWFAGDPLWYWADGNPADGDWTKPKPGIHMPRWASRLTLAVTAVRVERLQDISEADAIAEGIARSPHGNGDQWCSYPLGTSAAGWLDPRESYRELWNSINGAGAWDANPWVAVISFDVHRANVDTLSAQPEDQR